MRKITKIILSLWAVACLFFLIGCGGKGGELSNISDPTPKGAVEVTVFVPAGQVDSQNKFLSTKGKVTPPSGYEPLPEAQVTIVGTNRYNLTDEAGYTKIERIPDGIYTITISKEGYETKSFTEIHVNSSTAVIGDPEQGVTTQFSKNPGITNIRPTTGMTGDSIIINGDNFGYTQGNSQATFNGIAAEVNSWSNTQVMCTVPEDVTTGNVIIAVGSLISNPITFTVINRFPQITNLDPVTGAIETQITISGSNFGPNQGDSTVTFNNIEAAISSWYDTQIICTVPSGLAAGQVAVKVAVNSHSSNSATFTILNNPEPANPNITSVSPTTGPVGTQVTIFGNNFGSTQGDSTVTFNGLSATAISWSASQIVCSVPDGASTGNVVVSVNSQTSNGANFTVTVINQGKIVFSSDLEEKKSEVYSYDFETFTRLTDNKYEDYYPVFSPDGSKIAFLSTRTGHTEIFVMNSDGTNVVQLTDNNNPEEEAICWSPDGTKIAYSIKIKKKYQIAVINSTDGSDYAQLTTEDNNRMPAYSPDGTKIAFVSKRSKAKNYDLYIMDADGGNQTRLTQTDNDESEPAYSPDGTKIAFVYEDSKNIFNIYTINSNGTNLIQLTNVLSKNEGCWNPCWSPDGTKIVFYSNKDAGKTDCYDIITINSSDGSDWTNLTNNGQNGVKNQYPCWVR